MQFRVYYDDTDTGGVVYHTNYIKFCERARSEVLFANDIEMNDEKGYFLVKSLNANFIKSAVLGDILEVKTKVIKKKKASAVLYQSIYRDDIKIFESNVTVVFIKKSKISAIPSFILELLEKN